MDASQSAYSEPLNTASERSLDSARCSTPKSTALTAREEYSPVQASPTSFSRPHSATAGSSDYSASPVRPGSAASRRAASASGHKGLSPSGSDGAISPAGSRSLALRTDAFLRSSSMSPSSRAVPSQMSATKLKLHVQSLAANRSKEQLAEDLYVMQQSLSSAAKREKKLNTERLRLDSELRKAITETPKAGYYDPHTTSRSSSTSVAIKEKEASVISSLKETNRQLRAARDDLTEELSTLQRSTRATKASELEAEARMYLEEMDRQKKLAGRYAERVRELEESLARAQMELTVKRTTSSKGSRDFTRQTKLYNPDGTLASSSSGVDNDAAPRSLRQELQMATIQAGRGLTGGSKELRAALASMQSAHRLLVAEAAALRQFLPEGCSWGDLDPQRWKQAGVSPRGASAILRFLRTHEVRLHNELAGLPGAKRKDKDVKPPRELDGPDYYVMEKDLQKAVQATQRTKQDITRMSEEMRAAKEWKAEAQRLREQMDTHMQGLSQMVESGMSDSPREAKSIHSWRSEVDESQERSAGSVKSVGIGSVKSAGTGSVKSVGLGSEKSAEGRVQVDDNDREKGWPNEAEYYGRHVDAEAATDAAGVALQAVDAIQGVVTPAVGEDSGEEDMLPQETEETAADIWLRAEEGDATEEGEGWGEEQEIEEVEEEGPGLAELSGYLDETEEDNQLKLETEDAKIECIDGEGKDAAEPLEAKGASNSSIAPAMTHEQSTGGSNMVGEELWEEGGGEYDSDDEFARKAGEAFGDSSEEEEEDEVVGDEEEADKESVASSETRRMAEAMLQGTGESPQGFDEDGVPHAVEVQDDTLDAEDAGDNHSAARRSSASASMSGRSADRKDRGSLQSSLASRNGEAEQGASGSAVGEPEPMGALAAEQSRERSVSVSGSVASEKSEKPAPLAAHALANGSVAAEQSELPFAPRSGRPSGGVGFEASVSASQQHREPSSSDLERETREITPDENADGGPREAVHDLDASVDDSWMDEQVSDDVSLPDEETSNDDERDMDGESEDESDYGLRRPSRSQHPLQDDSF